MTQTTDNPGATATSDLAAVLREYMDVTGRLQQTHQALQEELTRLRAELASKDRELELRRRLAALGEMAAGVAHEVRNPLGAIQLYSGLLRNECATRQLGPALRLVEKIEAGIQAIEAVVQDTLALAPRQRELRACRVQSIVEQTREATARTLSVCRVQLVCRVCPDDVFACVDAEGLKRVLVNLVVNAAEASPAGRTVELELAGTDAELRLSVRDEGAGLPEEIRHRIFDPFFTTKQQGTGLGLTIAHRLVEAYGGRLSAANRPTGGAEFEIVLPRATADAAATPEREISAA
jgi:signal transduction histidine kinase